MTAAVDITGDENYDSAPKTPKEVVARLSQETLAVMRDPDVVKLLTDQQVTPMATGPQEFEAMALLTEHVRRAPRPAESATR